MTRIGCIADDLTGATDVASVMSNRGVRTALSVGVPAVPPTDASALVIALKSRSCAPDLARDMSREALGALRAWGAGQILFKICSTFDSTDRGNIGPVGDMLAEATDAKIVPVAPTYAVNGRTVYQGHLFVGDLLLSNSGMRDHPITPMREPDLRKVLGAQTAKPVGLVDLQTVHRGPAAIAARLAEIAQAGGAYAIADALTDADLDALAEAARDLPLLIGGAALGGAMAGRHAPGAQVHADVRLSAPCVALSGSCSRATLGQVDAARAAGMPMLKLGVEDVLSGVAVSKAVDFALGHLGAQGVLIYSSERAADAASGTTAEAIERSFGEIARQLVERGVERLVIAGGETSGAVIEALGIDALLLGPEIDPGVPWMRRGDNGLEIALKSGNFGAEDFFVKATACR